MATTDPHHIALWGPPAAGKTMFLAQLYLRRQQIAKHWDVFARGSSLDFIERNRALIDSQNRFVPRTDPGTTDQQVLYEFRHEQSGRKLFLAIDDRAGGDWVAMDAKEELQEVYRQAGGLILLFDCTAQKDHLMRTVSRTLERVRVAQGDQDDHRPVALCLSKADQLIETPAHLTEALEHPDGFMRRWLEARVSRHFLGEVARYFKNYRLFPVSSIGAHFIHGEREPIVFYDERFELRLRFGRELEPINLFAPIIWLFEQLEERDGD